MRSRISLSDALPLLTRCSSWCLRSTLESGRSLQGERALAIVDARAPRLRRRRRRGRGRGWPRPRPATAASLAYATWPRAACLRGAASPRRTRRCGGFSDGGAGPIGAAAGPRRRAPRAAGACPRRSCGASGRRPSPARPAGTWPPCAAVSLLGVRAREDLVGPLGLDVLEVLRAAQRRRLGERRLDLVARRLAVARRRRAPSPRRARRAPATGRTAADGGIAWRLDVAAACTPTRPACRRRRPSRRSRSASTFDGRAARARSPAASRSLIAASCWLSVGRKICPAPTNLNCTSPSSMTSPGSTMPRRSSAPLTRTPLLEPLSTISKRPSPSACTSQCRRDTELWLTEMRRVLGAADRHPLAVERELGAGRRAREHHEAVRPIEQAPRARARWRARRSVGLRVAAAGERRGRRRRPRPAGRCGSRRSGRGRRARGPARG